MQITCQGVEVDLSPPWQRYTMDESLVAVAGIDEALLNDEAAC